MIENTDKELRIFIERIERVDSEMVMLRDDKKDIFAEAKARGYDPKAMREVIRLRKMDPELRRKRQDKIDEYLAAFGIE